MNKDLKQFLDWLKENDRTEEEKMQCKLLDEYMKTRDNMPGKGVTGTELVFDPKSSEEIAEDLQPMYYMDIHIIANYEMGHLARHGLPGIGDIFLHIHDEGC